MGGKARRPSLSTTGNPHWCTDPRYLELARTFAAGRIALDPFGNPDSLVDAVVEYHGPRARDPARRVDSLAVRWIMSTASPEYEIPVAWGNPPYTRHVVDQCVAKMREEGRWGPLEVLGIVPHRHSSAWFRAHCFPPAATGLCMLDHRARYIGCPTPVPWETAIVHWGRYNLRFADIFSAVGTVWIR